MPSLRAENSPLLGTQFIGHEDVQTRQGRTITNNNERRKHMLWTLFLSAAVVCLLKIQRNGPISSLRTEEHDELAGTGSAESLQSSLRDGSKSAKSPYTKVQTLSFQIYTGGAPAFTVDKSTGKERTNHECKGLHSYGSPENSEALQCYLGLEDTAEDVERRLNIMTDAVNKAYDVSDKDDSTLKIFLAPEFYFRGVNGAFQFQTEEAEEENGGCSDICHIFKGLENIAANKRFENWLFLFGTVIASEALPKEDAFDYQFYNFAPLYKGFDPATSKRIGKNFIVPKRYVSNMDFLTPLRHLTNKSIAMELLDEKNHTDSKTLINPHASGQKRYANDIWARYKDELTTLGYNMIEYGWFFMDGISFSVEICLDHLVHRALMTYMSDVVTGSKTRIPSSANDSVEWVGIPKHQAQISLVSSAGMDATVASLALANGGHIFLQDGMEGDVTPHSTYGQDDCQPNEYEFFGGSQSVKRTAVISASDVTFEYEMNLDYKDYALYPESGTRRWKDVLEGVFSSMAYGPKLTAYDPVSITSTS